ncbi:hypothetical protein FRC17_002918 [Serendipita sp. 399]|nr:hypothetical protein FRC17_002918 [Serendipita sp. 399]
MLDFDKILNADSFLEIKDLDPFLPDILPNNYLNADKIKAEKQLDDLAKQFVGEKEVSTTVGKDLGIEGITRMIGVTALDEEGHVQYLTCCEPKVKTKNSVVFVKQPPNAKQEKKKYFPVPKKGPNQVPLPNDPNNPNPGPLPDPSKKEHGFKALEEPALLSPVWDGQNSANGYVMLYSYDRGIPLVDRNPPGHSAIDAYPRFAWELIQYCAHDPNDPDKVGGERFIFTGHSKDPRKRHSMEGVYMRLDDLKKRIEEGSSGTAEKDLDLLAHDKPLWPLWLPNGDLIPVDQQNSRFKALEPAVATDGPQKLYINYCKLVRQARLNGQVYDVLARFWDMEWKPDFYIQIDPGNKQQIRKYAMEKATPDEIAKVDSEISADDKALVALIERVKAIRVFKPHIRILWGTGTLQDRQYWGSHPNGLYRVWIDKQWDLSELAKVGVYSGKRVRPKYRLKEEVEKMRAELAKIDKELHDRLKEKYTTVVAPFETVTKLTETSINIAKNYKRKPSQIAAMGNWSPNDFVRDWWNIEKGEKAAEWLHRSAWSYGGLYDNGKVDPQSSQVMRNLVIGTHETNTMMIRVEIFVKRLAQYATKNGKPPVTVTVTTRNGGHDGFSQLYSWYCPKLVYNVKSSAGSLVLVDQTYEFFTLQRRLPTRFELELDELFERMVYEWKESDSME